jgi:hypothetical protein
MGKKLSATDGWFNRWKKRENIVYKHMRGAEKSDEFLAADEWIKREWPNIIGEYSPEHTYNADKTGLYFRAIPEHTYLFKNESATGFKSLKEHVTVLCCANI